nr:MAB_1171c family putative transporter [Saccharopolyspora rosea]
MASVVLWSAGLVAVLLSGHRLYRARRHLTPGVLYLCSAVSCVGVSAALAAPGTLTATLRLEPFPGATRLVANGFAMASAFCVHGLLINLVSERDRARRAVRRQLVLLVVAFAVLAGLLVAAPIRSTSDFVARYAREPAVVGYVLLFCAYIAWSLGNFVRLIQHHRRYSDRPLMRVGLAIAQVGTAVGTVWAVWKSVAALVVLATGRRLTVEGPVSAVLSAACVALIAVGVTLPTWFPLLARPVGWLRAAGAPGAGTAVARAARGDAADQHAGGGRRRALAAGAATGGDPRRPAAARPLPGPGAGRRAAHRLRGPRGGGGRPGRRRAERPPAGRAAPARPARTSCRPSRRRRLGNRLAAARRARLPPFTGRRPVPPGREGVTCLSAPAGPSCAPG